MTRISRMGANARWSSLMLVLDASFAICGTTGCAASSTSRPVEPPPRHVASGEASMPAPKDSDSTTNVFLTALRAGDFAKATSHFDATVKGALPEEKLAEVWRSLGAKLGELTSWTITERSQAGNKDVRVVLLKFEHGELLALISVNPKTQELAGLFFKPTPKPAAPAPYVDASAFRSEDVSLGSEPYVLKGTITLPAGKGPFPAAVLVHGSGPHDRDESIGGNKPFKDLAEGLASRGVAVLRYDKRTFEYGRQLSNTISIDDEVIIDAVAAVNLLKSRPEVDLRRVFVIGHSLGALLAPEIAVRSAPVAGAVLMAPPGRAPWDAILAQMRYLVTPPETLAEVEKAVELLKTGKLGAGTLLGAPASYWKDWASRDGIAMTRRLGRPILIMRGDRDYQVTEEDVAAWKKGLSAVSNVELMTVPGANHLFITGTGKPGPAEYEVPGHVDQGVIEKLSSFLGGAKPR